MEPRIVQLDSLQIVGVQTIGRPEQGDFAKTWPALFERCHEIPNRAVERVSYGVQSYEASLIQSGRWKYTAGLAVEADGDAPSEMSVINLPANTYAVFEYKGAVSPKLGSMFRYIYTEWLPTSGYEVVHQYDFERYDERFKGPDNADSVLEIYIPVSTPAS